MSGFIGDTKINPINNRMTSILGGGIPGQQSPGGLLGGGAGTTGGSGMVGSSARSRTRRVLRRAFGNSQVLPSIVAPTCAISKECRTNAALVGKEAPRRITPFRAAMTAGDPAGTVNSAASPRLPGSSQVSKSMPVLRRFGGVHNDGRALFTGNPTYVYDSSTYTNYRRLRANNRNYNDRSFGGDQSNASQVPLSHVRRF